MTTRIAIFLVCVVVLIVLADQIWLDGNLPLYLMRQMTRLIDWVIFWE